VDEHRHVHGVEPICRVLQIAPSGYRRHAARQRTPARHSARTQRDKVLVPHIERVWRANLQVYGADKVWLQLRREGHPVARCTVERLMRRQGIRGVIRGKVVRTTVSDPKAPCPLDWVNRQFKADRPNRLWVSDFTYVSTWQGWLYVAFVVDVFSRRIAGWRVSRSMRTGFVLDALEQALYARRPERDNSLIHHSDRGSQYVSIRYSERLAEAGIEPSVGCKGQVRQRVGADHQLAAQGRDEPSPRSLEEHGIGRAGDAGVGVVVQPSPASGADRQYPASGVRSQLLSVTRRVSHLGLTHSTEPPRNPGRLRPLN
jgi:putative transposase